MRIEKVWFGWKMEYVKYILASLSLHVLCYHFYFPACRVIALMIRLIDNQMLHTFSFQRHSMRETLYKKSPAIVIAHGELINKLLPIVTPYGDIEPGSTLAHVMACYQAV